MTFKGLVATLVFCLAWIKSVSGAPSYSNVYVQSGPSLASAYGPAALTSAALAPLAASPLMSNVLPPCVSPCVIPSQQIVALAPVATSSANFVSYKSPLNVPVVVAPTNDDTASYEYSYVVYDEDTGDQKAQKEMSDNGVVRGQYSLVQPDGYVREVQYTADDLRGFNAVVKNFVPKYALNTGTQEKAIPPCPEVKSEPLKVSTEGEAHDLKPEAKPKNEEYHDEEPKLEANEESENRIKTEQKKEEGYGDVESYGEPRGKSKPEGLELQGESKTLEAKVEPVPVIPKEQASPENNVEGGKKKEEAQRAEQSLELKPNEINPLSLVSYNDVIKCIQAAIRGAASTRSPITYIVLNKPC